MSNKNLSWQDRIRNTYPEGRLVEISGAGPNAGNVRVMRTGDIVNISAGQTFSRNYTFSQLESLFLEIRENFGTKPLRMGDQNVAYRKHTRQRTSFDGLVRLHASKSINLKQGSFVAAMLREAGCLAIDQNPPMTVIAQPILFSVA